MAGFSKPSGGSGLNQLTGDVTAGPGAGSQAATLATVSTAQTVGDASHYPIVTTDAKGRVTGMTAQAIAAGTLNSYATLLGGVTIPNTGVVTVLGTVTLPIGSYLMNANVGVFPSASVTTPANPFVTLQVANGTGTATFGPSSGQFAQVSIPVGTVANGIIMLGGSEIITVTVAGTFVIAAQSNVAVNSNGPQSTATFLKFA